MMPCRRRASAATSPPLSLLGLVVGSAAVAGSVAIAVEEAQRETNEEPKDASVGVSLAAVSVGRLPSNPTPLVEPFFDDAAAGGPKRRLTQLHLCVSFLQACRDLC
ncbi:hypothetical protein AAHE18_05G255900 [Arachis hypogaea]|nr:uncharacterized protein DS421_5g166210 [Arachis hypogaea]